MKYQVILADPPWTYKSWSEKGEGRSAANHYKTMPKRDIQRLDVQSVAADDCVLFLWVTMPCLLEGIELIKRWGFTYKTVGFVWIKKNKKSTSTNFWGMGYWTRANAELCLLATKGKIARINRGVHQVVESPVEVHSRKPAEVRDRITKLVGDLPKIELFARENIKGWDAFGNEVKESISIPFKNQIELF